MVMGVNPGRFLHEGRGEKATDFVKRLGERLKPLTVEEKLEAAYLAVFVSERAAEKVASGESVWTVEEQEELRVKAKRRAYEEVNR